MNLVVSAFAEALTATWQALVDQPPDQSRREQLRAETRVHAELLQRLQAIA